MRRIAFYLLLAISCPAFAGNQMQFKISPSTAKGDFVQEVFRNGQHEIFATGKIVPGTADKFVEFMRNASIDSAVVVFDSPGGSLTEAFKLGKAIRNSGYDTAIGSYGPNGISIRKGTCASACAYSFAGGVYRYYYGNSERLGIHQFDRVDNNQFAPGDVQLVSSDLIEYLQAMGVDAKAFIVASSARPDQMVWLTPTQAKELGFANNGSNPTTIEIIMAGPNPYLKVEQIHRKVTARVLFTCTPESILVSAGIVTSPSITRNKWANLERSYLEIPGKGELLVREGDIETVPVDDVLWLHRLLESSDLASLYDANDLGIWTENGGPFRWGATIDLRPAKEAIKEYAFNCRL